MKLDDELGQKAIRLGPLFGFLVASAIMAVMVVGVLARAHDDAVTNCEERNAQFAEVNRRVSFVNGTAETMVAYMTARLAGDQSKIAEGVPVIKATIRRLETVDAKPVPLTDCADSFSDPLPFWP